MFLSCVICYIFCSNFTSGKDQAKEHQRGRDVEELEEDERVHDQIR